MEIDAVRDLIDNSRAELLKSDPKAAELYGLDPKEVEANAPKETADAPAPEATKQAQPSTEIEGSDEELTRALKHPKIADAVASEWTKAETARQQYAHGLNLANQLAQQGVVDRLPELANLPIGQWGDAIITLAQQDPARVQQALAPLERAAKLQAVQNEWNQHQAAQQQAQRWQQIENHVKAEDARLVEMVGGQKAADQANQAMVDYLTERGVAKNQMVNVIAQNPVLRTAEARQTIWKAQQYDRLMAAPKAVPTTPKQHVLKPGNGAGKTGREISLGALEARFNRSASLDDAFALYSARNR
jgi:hypothetical protein